MAPVRRCRAANMAAPSSTSISARAKSAAADQQRSIRSIGDAAPEVPTGKLCRLLRQASAFAAAGQFTDAAVHVFGIAATLRN